MDLEGAMDGTKPILATTDFSDPSMTAVRTAVDLATRLGARLVLVYVVEDRIPPIIAAASSEPPDQIVRRHVETATKHINDWCAKHFPDTELTPRVLVGVPHDAIVRAAGKEDAAMIVIGHRGHGLLGHSLLGSTTARVVTEAPCPVLVVRREE